VFLDELADGVGQHRGCYPAAVRCAARQRFREVKRLLRFDLRGHWRLMRIDDRLDHDRPGSVQRLIENATAVFWPLDV
jgi:hypothetical protein